MLSGKNILTHLIVFQLNLFQWKLLVYLSQCIEEKLHSKRCHNEFGKDTFHLKCNFHSLLVQIYSFLSKSIKLVSIKFNLSQNKLPLSLAKCEVVCSLLRWSKMSNWKNVVGKIEKKLINPKLITYKLSGTF